ncbi:MAG: beta-eliminating lyase-related protein [Planctomycetota bacterium]|nr:beta-eliminating lyase-related protein [Planctomycetota bacterium]
MNSTRHFASDNNAPVHPAIFDALAAANVGHVRAYGDDPVTHAMEAGFREHFGPLARAHCVFGGTGANVLGLQALARPHEAVMCAEGAHIDVDECGAPEHYTGCKLISIATNDGKITPELVASHIHGVGDQHHVQPRVVSITQSSEVGSVYEPREIRSLAEFAHARSMYLHMDGARIANAAAALDVPLRAITTDVGVDVLSFGGTKNGLMGAEAVVFFNPAIGNEFKFLRKQGMQLASKMRFVAAQLARVLEGDLWKANASRANAMARRLGDGVSTIDGVKLAYPVCANGVFAILPKEWIAPLQERSFFYVWDEQRSVVRWMCSFDTTSDDVDGLIAACKSMSQRK